MEDHGDKLVFWIPIPRNYPRMVFLSIWSVFGLCLGMILLNAVISSIRSGNSDLSSILVDVVLWIIIGALLSYLLAWQFIGKEEVEVSDRSIKISQNVVGIKFPKEYMANHIKDLGLARVSVSDLTTWGRASIWWDFGIGLISFDYGAKTIKFAGGVFDAEAKQIVAEIQRKFPQYKN